MNRDSYSRVLITEDDLIKQLYLNPDLDLSKFEVCDPDKYNNAIDLNYSELPKLKKITDIHTTPEIFHKENQKKWFMPDEYKNLDIVEWVLYQCNDNETELQRCGMELLVYTERNMLSLLCYFKYLVDKMREEGILWGVGRGSSVASFVLYKIGIHKINSIEYDLDFYEFMR